MSFLYRARARLLACSIAAVAVVGGLAFAPTAGAANLVTGSTYLAVGDSLTYGFHAKQFSEEIASKGFAEAKNYEEGFVNDFGNTLKVLQPKLQIANLGCPGETTETALNGPGAPYTGAYCAGGPTGTPFPFAFLHHPYTHNTQVEEAEAILKENPNVSPITVDLGANDILQFLEHHCGYPATYTCTETEVANELFSVAGKVSTIVEKLKALAPRATIVVVGQYNPYPLALPSPGGDKSASTFNNFLSFYAGKDGVLFTAPLARFNPYSLTFKGSEAEDLPTICAYTAMCPGGTYNPSSPEADIHPTTLGYAVMGEVISALFTPSTEGKEGKQGPAGATGATGPTGAAGSNGEAGAAGTTGATGPTGAAGSNGEAGAAGSNGANGAAGTNGTNGTAGANGSNGAQGVAGGTGAAGSNGAAGGTGANGSNGAAGGTGANGSNGAAGSNGAKGSTGATGVTGAAGAAGSTGATGPAGAGIVGGGFGGAIWGGGWFNMSLYAQITPTPMIQAGTLRNFTVHFTTNANTNTTLVVEKNGVATGITCTVAKNTNTCSDNTHTAAFAASDTVLVHGTYPGSLRATNPSWSATYP